MRFAVITTLVVALTLPFLAFAQPSNDDICNAEALSLGSTIGSSLSYGPVDVTGATAQPGEPDSPVGTGSNSCRAQDGWCSTDVIVQNSTWYTFTGPSAGSVLIQTGGDFDTQLAVYGGSCTDILAGNGTFLGGNDDMTNGDVRSELTVSCLNDGETYYILVDGYQGEEGNLELALEVIPSASTLGPYPSATVVAGQNTTVTPTAAPTGISSLNAFADPGFVGVLTADPTTGVVTITDAVLAGTYTVTVAGPNGCATSSFTLTVTDPNCASQYVASTVASGDRPTNLAVGDFNNDGIQDLATCNSIDGNVSVHLGNGNGGFLTPTYISEPFAAKVRVGDFNGDGNQDLIVSNASSFTLSLHLGDGTGGFASVVTVNVGGEVFDLAIGDFNGDQIQDIVIASLGAIVVRLGDGTGGFTDGTNVGVGEDHLRISIGDFNNDGNEDLAVTSNLDSWGGGTSNYLDVRLGDGSGGFGGAISLPGVPRELAVGDFNEDGSQDIVLTNDGNVVSIRLGDGAGGFSNGPDAPVGISPSAITVADLNGDGIPDLAVSSFVNDNVSMLIGDGTGAFASAGDLAVGDVPVSVVAGDFNLDGIIDLATPNREDDNVSILLGQSPTLGTYPSATVVAGQNTTVTPSATPTGVTSLNAFADPGFTGVLTADPTTGVVSVTDAVLAGTYTVIVNANGGCATSSFTLTVTDPDCSAQFGFGPEIFYGDIPNVVAVGDFNENGNQDLAVGDNIGNHIQNSGSVSIHRGSGSGTFATPSYVSTGAIGIISPSIAKIAIGDFNGDGHQDFAATEQFSHSVYIRLGTGGGGFSTSPAIPTGNDIPSCLAIGDFNSDGYQDIVFGTQASNDIYTWLGDGDGGFIEAQNTSCSTNPKSIVVDDFNGDGIEDLAANGTSIHLGFGDGTFSADIGGITGSGRVVVSGDFNGDGNKDLAYTTYTNGYSIAIQLGNGTGGFTSAPSVPVGDSPNSIAIGDFNGDGIQDLVTANEDDDNISVRYGVGDGTFLTTADIPTQILPIHIAVGDFNEDGMQDLAIVHLFSSLSIRLGEAVSVTGLTQLDVGFVVTLGGNGTPATVDPWLSSNTGIATVDALGNVTGVAAGTVDITYTTESGCTAIHTVTVIGTPPANDNICYAIPLTVFGPAGNGIFDATNATAEVGEPTPPDGTGTNSCQSQDGWCNADNSSGEEPTVTNSVWFTFEAPASGNVTLNTESSTYDTQIAAYSGADCNAILAGNGTLLGANDDISGSIFQSEVTLTCLTPGETYFVQVDGWRAEEGDLEITMTDNLYLVSADITPTNQVVCDGIFETLSATIGADFTYLWTPGNETTQSIDVTLGTTYEVMVTDSNGCVATATQIITTEDSPVAGFTASDNGLTASFSDAFTGTVNSHVYDFGDGNTSTSSNPSHTYTTANTYNVCVTVTNDCGTDTDCELVTVDVLTGITEANLGSLALYPNPSDGTFNLELSGMEGQGTLNLMDMTGRVVHTESLILTRRFKQTKNLKLSSGVYILQLQTEEGSINRKIEVQ